MTSTTLSASGWWTPTTIWLAFASVRNNLVYRPWPDDLTGATGNSPRHAAVDEALNPFDQLHERRTRRSALFNGLLLFLLKSRFAALQARNARHEHCGAASL